MLPKALLRVSRAGSGYRPVFATAEEDELAAQLIGVHRDHVGETRAALDEALAALEREADDFKLVRGFATLLERGATFETRAAVPPDRARRAAFTAAEDVGVATEAERGKALTAAATELGVGVEAIEASLYADLDDRQVLVSFEPPWEPEELVDRYNLSLAQTALFDATEVRLRSSDPKALVSAVKRLGLMYEVRSTDGGREVLVTGPDALFGDSRRYGTRFARLLRTVAGAATWRLEATIDDRGTERGLTLTHEDPLRPPGKAPLVEPSYDSGVEAEFAARFSALDLDWAVVREPEPLEAGASVLIPDFAFDYRHAPFRVYFEIMGFWTPSYVERKLEKLARVEDVEMIVAVDDALGVGDEVAARDHRVVGYSGSVRPKDVIDALRTYEQKLVAESAASLPDELVPGDDVVSLSVLADRHGVSESALDGKRFPEHDLVGRTLIRPHVLEALAAEIVPGMSLAEAEAALEARGITEASAALAALGYRVEWEGLSGGTVRARAVDEPPE